MYYVAIFYICEGFSIAEVATLAEANKLLDSRHPEEKDAVIIEGTIVRTEGKGLE